VGGIVPGLPAPVAASKAHSVCDELATGGMVELIEIDGSYFCVHVFNTSGTFTLRQGLDVELLIVGGGGGGGGNIGGGGGAGEFIERTDGTKLPLALADSPFAITVGQGGGGGTEASGADGQDSSAFGIVAAGGGGGGTLGSGGRDGGSGGGSGSNTDALPGAAVPSGSGSGSPGGASTLSDGCRAVGGGGGGAGAAGGAAFSETSSSSPTFDTGSRGGDGGAGRTSVITGQAIAYAGGGGGGTNTGAGSCLGVTGGLGSSGAGSGAGTAGASFVHAGADARAGSGSGGGGAGNQTVVGGKLGGDGGSGIVIVRHTVLVTSASPATGESNDPRLGGLPLAEAVEPRMAQTGASSGTLTIGGTSGPPVQLLEAPGVDAFSVSLPSTAMGGSIVTAAVRRNDTSDRQVVAAMTPTPTQSRRPQDWQVGVSGATITEVASPGVEYNFPSTFQAQGYGDLCWKLEDFTSDDYTYVLPLVPEPILPNGDPVDDPLAVYTLVKVKAGSIVTDDPNFQANTIYEAPAGGAVVFADSNRNRVSDPRGRTGDKSISHVIICADLDIDLDSVSEQVEIAQTPPVPLSTPIVLNLAPEPGDSGTQLATVMVALTSGLQETTLMIDFNPTTFELILITTKSRPPIPSSIPAGMPADEQLPSRWWSPLMLMWLLATAAVVIVPEEREAHESSPTGGTARLTQASERRPAESREGRSGAGTHAGCAPDATDRRGVDPGNGGGGPAEPPPPHVRWYPRADLNRRYRLERAASWAARRRGQDVQDEG